MKKEIPDITPSQAQAFAILSDQQLKRIVTISFLIAFFVILVFIIVAFCVWHWYVGAICSGLEGILVITIRPMATHFFHAKKEAANLDKIV